MISSGFPYFLQFKSEFFNKELMIGATVSSWSCFCWLYRAPPSLAEENIINLIWVLTIWWCPCVEFSLVLLEEGVCYDKCMLLTHFNRPWKRNITCPLYFALASCKKCGVLDLNFFERILVFQSWTWHFFSFFTCLSQFSILSLMLPIYCIQYIVQKVSSTLLSLQLVLIVSAFKMYGCDLAVFIIHC